MSIWTHVVGAIRIDGLPQMIETDTADSISKIIGPMCLWEDDNWDKKSTLPCGSEGSLQYKIIEHDKGLSWIIVPIWGDLRDYDDVNEIRQWWNNLIDIALKDRVRQAVLQISVEGRSPVILQKR